MPLATTVGQARLVLLLWRAGVWEALQLQRCVVFFVLDSSGRVLAQSIKCFVTNGLIYLGSLAVYQQLTQPAADWLLARYALPVLGPGVVAAWRRLLGGVFQLAWLLPLYGVSLLASCIWYQELAAAAFEVQVQQQRQQQQQLAASASSSGAPPAAGALQQQAVLPQQQQQQQQLPLHPQPRVEQQGGSLPGTGMPQPQQPQQPAGGAAAGGGMMAVLEGTAQEVFRLLLFVVFTVEVYVFSLLPVAGPLLNVLFLSWLYAYYCFDYKWALQGVRLPQRLTAFEANWAFFAGFGFPCVAATAFLPFHIGAALANLLFPAFILVACGADPAAAQRSVIAAAVAGSAGAGAGAGAGGAAAAAPPAVGRIPIFKLALRPTYCIIQRAFGPRAGAAAAASAGSQSRGWFGRRPR